VAKRRVGNRLGLAQHNFGAARSAVPWPTVVSCARRAMCCCGDPPPGYDRGPTDAERELPPDKRPWTEYDGEGQPQTKPPFKGCAFRPLLICGPACCVFELQWCRECGKDADWCCDMCLCRFGRCKACLCCGPQCDTPICPNFCKCLSHAQARGKISMQECCEADCCDGCCAPRYGGCQICCCHCTCVRCSVCCVDVLCCQEEMLMMDGDLVPLYGAPPQAAEMER